MNAASTPSAARPTGETQHDERAERRAVDAGRKAQRAGAVVDLFRGRQRGAVGQRLGRRVTETKTAAHGHFVDLRRECRLAVRMQLQRDASRGPGDASERGFRHVPVSAARSDP